MRVDIGNTEDVCRARTRNSTSRLLTRLLENHDYSIVPPEGWAPKAERPFKEPTFWIVDEVEIKTGVPSIESIKRAACEHFRITLADFLSSRRTDNLVVPRQIAMYLAKTLTSRSLPDIGRRLGGRDHSTVLWAVRKMAHLAQTDWMIAYDIAQVEARL